LSPETDLVTTKGDLLVGTAADTLARQGVGIDGYRVTAASGETNGLKYDMPSLPVFADASARDAAFGGTGEKVLAEGQFAFTEDTNTTWFYTGAVWSPVSGQFATAQTNSTQSTASTTYVDLSTVTEVTVTTGTSALCVWHSAANNATSNAGIYVSVAVSGATTVAASDTISCLIQMPTSASSGLYIPMSSGHIFTGLTAGSNTFTIKYRTSSGTAFFNTRGIQVVAL
jgi:hypothetical protein